MLTQSSNKWQGITKKKKHEIVLIIQNLSKRVNLQICIKSLSVSIFFFPSWETKTLVIRNVNKVLVSVYTASRKVQEDIKRGFWKMGQQWSHPLFLQCTDQRWRPLILGSDKGTGFGNVCNQLKLLGRNINTACFQSRSGIGKTLHLFQMFHRYERTKYLLATFVQLLKHYLHNEIRLLQPIPSHRRMFHFQQNTVLLYLAFFFFSRKVQKRIPPRSW